MRVSVYIVALLGAATLCLADVPVGAAEEDAAAEEVSRYGEDRWVPSVALVSGVAIQRWRGEVQSTFCNECPIPDPNMGELPLREAASGGDSNIAPFFGAHFELMSPALPIRTSPRLFVGASIVAAFGFERSVAIEGDPGELASPLPDDSVLAPFSEDLVIGQGSRTAAQIDSLVYGLHAGVALPFELYGRRLWFKSALGWTRYEVDVTGLVVDAQCTQVAGSITQCNESLPNGFLREVRLENSGSGTFDGIGPAFDLELDTGRFGPIGSSIFVGMAAYYVLGDRRVSFGDGTTISDQLGTDAATAQFDFEMDRWMLRAGLGMRFHWIGSGD